MHFPSFLCRVLLLTYLCVAPAWAGVSSPPMQLLDEGIPAQTSFFIDCQGTGIVCDYNVVTGRWQIQVNGTVGGNASTADALAVNPGNCSTGSAPLGIAANGDVESCFDVMTQTEGDAHTTATTAHSATAANTASRIVLRDASGNFVAGTITAALTGNADTASAFDHNPSACSANQFATDQSAAGVLTCSQPTAAQIVNTPAGTVAATTVQTAIDELGTEKAALATLTAGGTINTGGNPVDWTQLKNVPSGIADGADDTGGMTSWNSRTGAVIPAAGDYTAASITNVPAGDIAAQTAQTAINELDTEKASLATLATNDGTINQGGDLVSWNKLKDVPAGFADGEDGGGVGGGEAQGFQANADIDRTVTNADLLASAVCIGGATQNVCAYGNATDGAVIAAVGGNMVWRLADTFIGKVVDNTGASIMEFDNETLGVLVPNTLTVTGALIAPNVVKHTISDTAPTATDDETDGYAIHSQWIDTTPNPDALYILTNATAGAAGWVPYSSFSQVDKSLNDAFNIGPNITGATSSVTAFCVGDGTGKKCSWYDGATGWHEEVTPAQHNSVDIPATFAHIIRYNGTEISRWDSTGKQIYANTGRPLKSVEVQGYEFGACAYTEAAIVAGRSKIGSFTCTDIDTDGFYFNFATPLNWNAGTVTVRLSVLSVNATPTGNVVLTCSGNAVRDGDVIPTVSTTGEQSVTLGLATQYKEEQATSAAITLNGTAAAGARLYMHCDVDATLTTANSMADVRIIPMAKVFYTTISNSE